MAFTLKGGLSFITQPKRQLPSISIVGSGQSLCGSFPLPDWRKEATFDRNANVKVAAYDRKSTSICLD